MRKFSYLFAVMVVMLLIVAGCGANEEEASPPNTEQPEEQVTTEGEEEAAKQEEEKPADLSSGLDEVSTSLKDLQSNIETVPQDADQLKTAGKDVEEKWDAIEEQIEEQHPEDYKNIEESLYPLIDETKKDEPDVEKMKPLLTDTMKKIDAFKEKVSSGS
ncbi:hypothetical protein F9802_16270 [Bacillus aerolatus]|uniref:Lipoprotein n=1 Tax=Bacillus aerolatus TaxID=2653354 RepID=A0A6I1FGU2_9BACI|nr:hypothetical protein [Bacillus aerolatus]KAB7704732.1 hypothetical protein F9802_16270 [Bacillus aerolatus]